LVHREFLNGSDCVEEVFPIVELELDKPTPAALSPIVILFKHALGVLWYAT
jgi:hypothetical protein